MLKLVIFLFLIIGSISLYIRKFNNPYKLIFIFGKKGSGKSTFLTKIALDCKKKNIPCYSNVFIYSAKLFNVDDIGHFTFPEDSVVLIDETKTIWDSRDFKSFKPEVRDFFVYLRHYKVTCYMTSQAFNIDKTLRDLCDVLYLSEKIANVVAVLKPISKKITIPKPKDDSQTESVLVESYKFMPVSKWKLTWIPRYIKFFDSYATKPLPEITSIEPFTLNKPLLNFIEKNSNYRKYNFIKFKTNLAFIIKYYLYKPVHYIFNKVEKLYISFTLEEKLFNAIQFNCNL